MPGVPPKVLLSWEACCQDQGESWVSVATGDVCEVKAEM